MIRTPVNIFLKTVTTVFVVGVLSSCSSKPVQNLAPSWARDATRNVDNGYIVYVESADNSQASRAQSDAESLAFKDLQNECTLIPKGARIEDRYDQVIGLIHQSYVKVAVEFQLCEEAKRALEEGAIRKLANIPMTEQVKRYQDAQSQLDLNEELVADNSEEAPDAGSNPSNSVNWPRSIPPVRNETQYFVIREQIAQTKQVIILSPPNSTVATTLAQQTAQVQQYEVTHPAVKRTAKVWTQVHANLARQKVKRLKPSSIQLPATSSQPGKFKGRGKKSGYRRHKRNQTDYGQ